MIRPRTGRTPDNERQAKSLQALRDAGGDKVTVRLPAESLEQLARLQAELELPTKTEAVIYALALATKPKRKPAQKAAAKAAVKRKA